MYRPAQLILTTLACTALSAASGLVPLQSAAASAPSATATRAGTHARRAGRVRHSTCRSSARTRVHARRAGCKAAARKLRTEIRGRSHPSATTPPPARTVTETGTGVSAAGNGPLSAAAVAAALATPCANTELTPEAGNAALISASVLCLVNHERAQHGENPLRLSDRLEAAAEGHCSELIADDYFAHVSPSGETPVDRIRATGYIPGPSVGYVLGENLAWGTYSLATPQAIVAAWIASPGHLANILEAKYTETGIGITAAVPASPGNGAPGATYAQEFGVIIH